MEPQWDNSSTPLPQGAASREGEGVADRTSEAQEVGAWKAAAPEVGAPHGLEGEPQGVQGMSGSYGTPAPHGAPSLWQSTSQPHTAQAYTSQAQPHMFYSSNDASHLPYSADANAPHSVSDAPHNGSDTLHNTSNAPHSVSDTSHSSVSGLPAGMSSPFNLGAPAAGYGYTSAESAGKPQPSSSKKSKKRTNKSKPGWGALIVASALAAVVGAGVGAGGNYFLQPSTPSALSQSQKQGEALAPVVESKGEAPNWQEVQKAVGGSVVAIDAQLAQGASAGSGVIIDDQGHVLTNEHVISGAQDIYITLADARVFKGELTGKDAATDLAVITIQDPPEDLTVATLGDSSSLHVGQDVAAIGNPLGLSSTMTTGIISALNRPVTTQAQSSEEQMFPFGSGQSAQAEEVVTNAVQLDAAVNPGNSGGPVFDSAGRVIGIASSIASLSGSDSESGSIGLGFAIPINLARDVAQQLIDNGVAEHAFLGVTIKDGAANYDNVTKLGAEVASVSSGTPAAKAGIREGDVIVSIDGNSVSSATSLTGFVRQYKSADVVKISLERNGKLQEVQVTLAAREDKQL